MVQKRANSASPFLPHPSAILDGIETAALRSGFFLEKDQGNAELFRSRAVSWLFADSIGLDHGGIPQTKADLIQTFEKLSHRQCGKDQSTFQGNGGKSRPPVSVPERPYPKGRSGTENGGE